MKKIVAFISLLISFECAADKEFLQTRCDIMDHGVLLIQFSSDSANRRVSLNPLANLMTFKGTTLKDMKWATEMDKVESFTIENGSTLQALFKDGRQFNFGKVDTSCEEKLKKHLGDLFNSS